MEEIGVISPVLRRKAKVESEGKPKKADNEDEEDAEAAATAPELVATKAAEAAKAITAASNRINSRVVTEWTSALRGLLHRFIEYSHDFKHHVHIYSRRSAAGSARTKVIRCHMRKRVCLIWHVQ